VSFTSFVFFPFLLAYLIISAVVPQRAWLWLTAIASAIFYAYWDWRFLFLLYYVSLVSWFCGRKIAQGRTDRDRKFFVVISITSCLTVLGIFKYFDFFTTSFLSVTAAFGLPLDVHVARIVLPVGISFYTFHALSYTIDIYRRKLARPADFLSVTVYLSFFPQLVAGPIVRAHRFLPQIARGPIFSPRKIKTGLLIIVWGYFLKIAVADSIALVIDPIFATPTMYSAGDRVFSIIAYSFQIYGDFAGYSFVAIGLAKLQGFDFPANFLAPYFSRSVGEFWRRWHISLSSFLRDYLYIPLGGNRHGRLQEYRNLFVTMFLGGLWHGASYNFIIWGSLHGVYLACQRLLSDTVRRLGFEVALPTKIAALRWVEIGVKMATVYALVVFAWIFFRIQHFSDATQFIRDIAAWQGGATLHSKFLVFKAIGLIAIVVGVDAIFINRRRLVGLLHRPLALCGAMALIASGIELFGSFGGGAFIYFRF